MRIHTFFLPVLCAVFFLACTKTTEKSAPPSATEEAETSSAYATRLSYAEPTSSGWRFSKVRGTGIASDPLILELRGPEGRQVKGISLLLNLGQNALSLRAMEGSRFVAKSPGMDLGSGQQLSFDKLENDTLHCGIYKKTGYADAGQGIFQIALALKDDAQPTGEITGISIPKRVLLNSDDQQTNPSIAFGAIYAE